MTAPDTATKVRSIIARRLTVEADKVTAGANLVETLGADSLDIVELAIALEDEFGVELDDETVEHVATVDDVVKAVEAAVARRTS
ncbi:acyl carrier protein [Aurantimonas sp. 22II-16-19i]|uniref:acyl carrier protein n=1 Tax=Aurantimonas sp. 22II-16-19i TaxID=1317114 RepID=UPI0009F7EDA0|nr:acyl carrier protein [Aurantimonas sp. 22II-16-19i]ORE87815.1 acyl carrier protein [Aurantimonas sp. 22II-16-19i]